FAHDPQLSTHATSEIATDSETEANALTRLSEGTIELHELLEDALARFRRNAFARIAHRQRDLVVPIRFRGERHAAARRCMSDGVRDQIEHDLTELLAIGDDTQIGVAPAVLQ